MVIGIISEINTNAENTGQAASRQGVKQDAGHLAVNRDDPVKYVTAGPQLLSHLSVPLSFTGGHEISRSMFLKGVGHCVPILSKF